MKHNFKQWEEVNEIKSTKEQIDKMLLDEEVYCKQRSRADWLKEGDKNTKYFHLKASSRKRKNQIWGVMNQQDAWVDDREGIEKEFCEYFANLFATSNPSEEQIEVALTGLRLKVNSEMNSHLDLPFTEEKVSTSLSQMCPNKASELDGLPTTFF